MKPANHADFFALLLEHDTTDIAHKPDALAHVEQLREAFAEYFASREAVKTVLGIDIYQYSRLDNDRQRIVPGLFRRLYEITEVFLKAREPFLFQNQQFKERFIPTGDGGFQIFDTPLHGLVFASYFQFVLSTFNGFYTFPCTREIMGPISLRYAITTDRLFQLDDNFYGPAIITNARILARDTLNRLLMDGNSIVWYHRNLGNIDTLLTLTEADLVRLPALAGYDTQNKKTYLFTHPSSVRSVHVQKIGLISSKHAEIDVYSLQLQLVFERSSKGDTPVSTMVVTIGNLNATGLS